MTTSSSSSSSSRVTGLVSGFDTQSIVESFMAMEKVPMTKLEVKKQTEDLRLQAYQAVNTYVLKFKNSMNTLSSKTLWNAKASVSTNEKVINATANQYAVNGSYSFKVAQLAAATQYMSKGVASKSDPLVKLDAGQPNEKIGSINLSSGKTRVDNSVELESLNGGKGVYRGSVRISDASNTTSIIDLSSCITMDDVVRTLNESQGAQISAKLVEGKIVIEDASNGSGNMKITNVGTGTTATDLGIVGASKDVDGKKVIEGRNVYTLGNNTAVTELNDGMGIEEGIFTLQVTNGDGAKYNLSVDTTGCKTIGDITKKLNDLIKEQSTGIDKETGQNKGDMPSADGMLGKELDGLHFGVSEDGSSLALSGTKAGLTYEFLGYNTSNKVGQAQPVVDLGLYGHKTTVLNDGDMISYDRILGGVNSPMLKNLNGANGNGIGVDTEGSNSKIPAAFNKDTKLSALNEGKGLDISVPLQFRIYEGGKASKGTSYAISDIVSAADMDKFLKDNPNATLEDLRTELNDRILEYSASGKEGAQALIGMSIEWNAAGNGLVWQGAQSGYEYEVYGSVAGNVGLQRNTTTGTLGLNETYSAYNSVNDFLNGDRLISGNNFLDENSTIDSFVGMSGIPRYVTVTETVQKKDDDGDLMFEADGTTPIMETVDVEVDNPDYMKQKVDGDGNLVYETDDDGNPVLDGNGDPIPVMEFDETAWREDCTRVLNGDAPLATQTTGGTLQSFEDALGNSITFTVGGEQINLDWDDVLDEFGGRGNIDWSTIKVDDFLEKANEKIAAAFKDYGDAQDPKIYLAAPQLTANKNGDGLGWTNIDFSKTYDIEGFDAFGLDYKMSDLTPTELADQFGPFTDVNAGNASHPMAMEPGYVVYETITEENAADHTLSELNLGVGLGVGALAGETLDLTLSDGNTVSIKFDDVIAHMGGGTNFSDKTVEEYLEALNHATRNALDAEYGAGSTTPTFEWGIRGSGLALVNVSGTDSITFGASKEDMVLGEAGLLFTGIGKAAGESIDFTTGNMAPVGSFNAATYHDSVVTSGIGSIDLTVGNSKTVTLNTDGLSKESTLADLIAKLNDELDRYAAMGDASGYDAEEREALKDIRFTINESGTGIAIDNTSSKAVTFHDTKAADGKTSDNNTLAQDLGLIKDGEDSGRVDAFTLQSGGSLGRRYISRATKLEEYIGKDAEKGAVRITDATGRSMDIPMEDAKTLGDVIDYINVAYNEGILGVKAELNETGDGIVVYEAYNGGVWPDADKRSGMIKVEDAQGGSIASKLGFAGTGKKESGYEGSVIDGKMSKSIDVYANDSLEDIMYRVSEAGYKAAIVNDGSSGTPYRLTISANNTGKANDFVVESDIDLLGFNQTQRGRDSKVLSGDPSSNPTLLSSATNSNSSAILGLTLDLKSVSDEWVSITVDTDKDKVAEEIKNMVSAYNDLSGIIKMLDGYDEETGEKGILYNDNAVKRLMDDIDDFFYQVFDPENMGLGATKNGERQTWSWQDLGITLTAVNSNADGSGNWYSVMDLDEEKLNDMIASKWDVVSAMMAGERNIANSNAAKNVRPSASFNGSMQEGYDLVDSAINGNTSKSAWGTGNGIMASNTIASGADTYTLIFQQATTITRMNIMHASKDTSLKDYDIEFLNSKTGEWEKHRSITDNASDANYLSVTPPTEVSGVRLVAKSSNAEDDLFRLLDFQVFEETGLASQLNQYANSIGDTMGGFLATQNKEIQNNLSDIEEQMSRLQNKLDSKEESLWRKFTAMEVALGNLQNQGSYFTNMMSSMSGSK